LWRLSCHSPAPHDSGLVFGTIRSAVTGAPVRGATVDVSWWDLRLDENHHVVERTWHMDARSNDRGSYAVCGVPREASVSIQASIDSSASGTINLPLTDVRVQRRDLRIGPIADSTGAITGLVTDPDGNVLQGARVARDGTRNEVRSAPDGRFTLIDAPPGTRSLEARFIGTVPTVSAADVRPGDTTEVVIRVPRAVALAAMRTIATYGVRVLAAEFAERRRLGWGYMRDSLELSKYSELVNALRDVPGMSVQYRGVSLRIALPDGKGGSCAPDVIIDGGSAALGHLIDLSPAEIGGLEVYTRADHIPERFVQPGIHPQCGMILVWTKYGFRNR
ncbi:MAG TPA: carboxypeptidase-like regulatory domain-containing protein, partial [Gemmatimonadaceae bacterium]|nr:carboxypeptidase-like regulatory domain-containing protein [Gemmatimonadaceae bacterium]